MNLAAASERCDPLPVTGVREFHQSLPNYAPTPILSLPEIANEIGVRAVFVKDESNRFGLPAFKALGASWGCFRAVAQRLGLSAAVSMKELSVEAKKNSLMLVAATEGNHGRAVAFMARLLGIESRIFVAQSMDEATRGFIAEEGACVTIVKGCYDMAVREAFEQTQISSGALLIQDTAFDGYEDVPAWIVEGYSTMMSETEQQISELGFSVDLMVTPVGVGSLAHAVARHCKSRETPASIVTVESDSAPCLSAGLRAGKPVTVQTSATIMDGMNCGTVSTTAWPDLQRLVDVSITVSSYESHCAVKYLASRLVHAGPCGGASLAALQRLAVSHEGSLLLGKDSVVVLLSTEGPRDYAIPRDVSMDDVVSLTQALTRINSSNPTLSVTDGVGESEIADFLSAWFAHRDIEFHRIEPVPNRPSTVGILRGSGGGRALMFNGHVDTVSLSSYEGDALSGDLGVKDGQDVVFGRGSLDMKGGLAAALAALSTIKASGHLPRGDVIVAAVSDEEDASQGTRDIIAAGWKADGAIVAEPTANAIATAHKGFIWVEVEVLGVAAHGSDPAAGQDAILSAGWFLRALEQFQTRLPEDDLLGKASLHCGLIRGGEEPSSYPGKCTVTIEFRTIPSQTEEGILQDLKGLLHDVSLENARFGHSDPRITMSRPNTRLSTDHPLIAVAAESASAVFGGAPDVKAVPFWCDAALLGAAGIPSIVLGPAGGGLHSKEEWVEVESVRQMTKVYTDLIWKFCT